MNDILQIAITSMPSGSSPLLTVIAASSALLTPVIAIFGATIAIQQNRINKNRLKYELCDRVEIVYEKTVAFWRLHTRVGSVSHDETLEFYNSVSVSKFYCSPEIVRHIEEMKNQAIKCFDFTRMLYTNEGFIKTNLPSGELSRLNGKISAIQHWMVGQKIVLDRLFSDYLSIKL